jgi:uncharacterized membrane protein YkvA (DUF1232 family)
MTHWWQVVLTVAGGLVVAELGLILALWKAAPDKPRLGELLRLLPDAIVLLRRLASDRAVPLSVRIWLWLLLAYLASPLDLVPDFIPLLGYADDAVLVAVVLRSVVRRAGTEALQRNWPGTKSGLAAVCSLVGIPLLAPPDATSGS